MRAAVVARYGPPETVRLTELPVPRPGVGELLIKVHAAGVSSGDARIRAARFPRGFGPLARLAFGLRGPRRPVLGGTFSGSVVSLGHPTDGFAVGDQVAGMTGSRLGTHAEYCVAKANSTVLKPAGVTHSNAAGVLFGGSTAVDYLRDRGGLRPAHRVLVVGASGAVGTAAVQLARLADADVTAVCSGRNADLVRALGAGRVIDYTRTEVGAITERFDIVLDAVGILGPQDAGRLLTDDGRLLLAVASLVQTLTARGAVKAGPARERAEDFRRLLALVDSGDLRVEIQTELPLREILAAHRLVDSGRKVGNVVVLP